MYLTGVRQINLLDMDISKESIKSGLKFVVGVALGVALYNGVMNVIRKRTVEAPKIAETPAKTA